MIGEPSQVRSTIARTIGLYDGPERAAAAGLLPHLAERSMLLVLDNFEHVLDAAGEVTAMLEASPESRVDRDQQGAAADPGEQEYPVRPLPHSVGAEPSATSADDAFRLFVDRARAVRPDWQPGSHAPVVREICRLLDGLPLGIELRRGTDRLCRLRRFGTGCMPASRCRAAGRGIHPRGSGRSRRRSAGATDSCQPTSNPSSRELSVFEGSFDAEQAAAVASPDNRPSHDVLDGLMSLAEQSLLIPDAGHPRGGARRNRCPSPDAEDDRLVRRRPTG